jgi:hypothetical protein
LPTTLARCRALPAALIILAVLCLPCASAHAGTYDITSCNPDGTAYGWSPYRSGSWVQSGIACPTNGDLGGPGLAVVNVLNAGVTGYSGGGLMFNAPAGTSLVGIGTSLRMQRWDDSYWLGLITGSGYNLYGAWANDGRPGYTGVYTPTTWFGLNREGNVHLEVGCSGLCDTAVIGSWPYYRVWAQMYDPILLAAGLGLG